MCVCVCVDNHSANILPVVAIAISGMMSTLVNISFLGTLMREFSNSRKCKYPTLLNLIVILPAGSSY